MKVTANTSLICETIKKYRAPKRRLIKAAPKKIKLTNVRPNTTPPPYESSKTTNTSKVQNSILTKATTNKIKLTRIQPNTPPVTCETRKSQNKNNELKSILKTVNKSQPPTPNKKKTVQFNRIHRCRTKNKGSRRKHLKFNIMYANPNGIRGKATSLETIAEIDKPLQKPNSKAPHQQ